MGDPNSRTGQRVQYLTRPIVAGANYTVRCACGTALDIKAASARAAVEQFIGRHRHTGPMHDPVARVIDYAPHPLYQQVCPTCGEQYVACRCEKETP